jgi:spore germination protein GerM
MSRRAASFVLGLALALLLGGGLWYWLSGRSGGLRAPSAVPEAAVPTGPPVNFSLYFPADGGDLAVEQRALPVPDAPKERIRAILGALLAGPKKPGLARPFPEGVTLGPLALGPNGIAYVDFRWQDPPDPPAGGSTEELQRIYSVVDSICLNVPQAQKVVLLWNGVQRETFSGHLDLTHPLGPDRGAGAAAP